MDNKVKTEATTTTTTIFSTKETVSRVDDTGLKSVKKRIQTKLFKKNYFPLFITIFVTCKKIEQIQVI